MLVLKGKPTETKETMLYLLHEMRKHQRYVLSNVAGIVSPQIPRAIGELMAQDMIEPLVFLGEVNFRLTKKGFSFIKDIPLEEVALDHYGYCYNWRD